MEQMDEDQKADLMEAWQEHDTKNTNRADATMLQKIMRSMGQNLPFNDCTDIISENGGGGFIDRDRWIQFMSKKVQRVDTEEELVMAFQAFDKDGKGFITSVELRHILTNLGDRLADEEAENLVNQADPQGGGQINYANFVRMMMQAMK